MSGPGVMHYENYPVLIFIRYGAPFSFKTGNRPVRALFGHSGTSEGGVRVDDTDLQKSAVGQRQLGRAPREWQHGGRLMVFEKAP